MAWYSPFEPQNWLSDDKKILGGVTNAAGITTPAAQPRRRQQPRRTKT